MSRILVRVVAGAVIALTTVGCGEASDDGQDVFPAAATPYTGPLSPASPGPQGVAGSAVDCRLKSEGSDRGTGAYTDGATAATAAAAVDTAMSEGLFFSLPEVPLALAAQEPDRQLLTYEAQGRVLLAVLVQRGPAVEGTGGEGWFVQSWSRCDWAEFPAQIAEARNYMTWTDARGIPVPAEVIHSFIGPEHCDWQDMTFLDLPRLLPRSTYYVRQPTAEMAEAASGPFVESTRLPPDATDTGFERDGGHLWTSADGRTAFVGTRDDVAAWPSVYAACA